VAMIMCGSEVGSCSRAQEVEGPSRRNSAVRPSTLDAAVAVRDRQKKRYRYEEDAAAPTLPSEGDVLDMIAYDDPAGTNYLSICPNWPCLWTLTEERVFQLFPMYITRNLTTTDKRLS
jgi:hypothetical protein